MCVCVCTQAQSSVQSASARRRQEDRGGRDVQNHRAPSHTQQSEYTRLSPAGESSRCSRGGNKAETSSLTLSSPGSDALSVFACSYHRYSELNAIFVKYTNVL